MNLLSEYFFLHQWLPTTVQENQAANWAVVNFNFQKGNQAFVSVPIRNIQFITTLERLSESYMMNDHLFCINKCLVRLLKQKVCKKQYTGKTVDKFRLRWNNYTEESDRKFLRDEEIKQKFLHDHFFRDDNHSFEEDLSICFIDKSDPSDPPKTEYYWMKTLKTITPFGLNTKETYLAVYTITRFSSVLLI